MKDDDAGGPPATAAQVRASSANKNRNRVSGDDASAPESQGAALSLSPLQRLATDSASAALSVSDEAGSTLGEQQQPQSSRADSQANHIRRHARGKGRRPMHGLNRSNGAFLLSDSIWTTDAASGQNTSAHSRACRRRQDAASIHRSKHGATSARYGTQWSTQGETAEQGLSTDHDASYSTARSLPAAVTTGTDMDPAQIVNMALNLGEWRRLVARRNVSQPEPPRLAPLPDSVDGGSLKQHLQQQRKVSKNASPRPERAGSRTARGQRTASLQTGTEIVADGAQRTRFSQSTLARALKAKTYLELLAQYRRVLDHVPPLAPKQTDARGRLSAPDSPDGSVGAVKLASSDAGTTIGRAYNPLQYLRNQKVRAREQKAINGDAQGFNDVSRVTDWVDQMHQRVVTGEALGCRASTVAPYCQAEEACAMSPTPATSRRPKRPRMDWCINPADMLADVYWLEQGDNKTLVEDRHWRRVFPQPQPTGLCRSLVADKMPKDAAHVPGRDLARVSSAPMGGHMSKTDHEHLLSNARDRAQLKLRALKGGHHRRSSHGHGRDKLRLHRPSMLDTSDDEGDRRRGCRSGGVDILEKQMRERIAQEQRESDSGSLHAETPRSKAESSSAGARGASPNHSLNLPKLGRCPSLDESPPSSPEIMVFGLEMSPPSSRPGSPSRNPLSLVKSMFGERSRERPPDPPLVQENERDSNKTAERGRSRSPPFKILSRPTNMSHKSQRSMGSSKLRGDRDDVPGLRALLRGPARIDSVLRSGVSKVSDMLWKAREGVAAVAGEKVASGPSTASEDDSEVDQHQSRAGGSAKASRASSRHSIGRAAYLDAMPPSAFRKMLSVDAGRASRSAKPPKPHLQAASTAAEMRRANVVDWDGSDVEAEKAGAALTTLAAKQPNAFWSLSPRPLSANVVSTTAASSRRELARLRTLVLSSGIVAMELDRGARQRKSSTDPAKLQESRPKSAKVDLYPDPATQYALRTRPGSGTDMYALAERVLAAAVRDPCAKYRLASDRLAQETSRRLQRRIDGLRHRAAGELMTLVAGAADEADEAGRDLATEQRLKVKSVTNTMEIMLRRKRRRFRWARRAGWLAVEWVVVAAMWYVWFVVVIARLMLGVGRGVMRTVRWLLWL